MQQVKAKTGNSLRDYPEVRKIRLFTLESCVIARLPFSHASAILWTV